jgi:hypothetical protein
MGGRLMGFLWPSNEARTTHEDLHLQGKVMQMTLDIIKEQISEMKETAKDKHREMESSINEIKKDVNALNQAVILQSKGIGIGSFFKDYGFPSLAFLAAILALFVAGLEITMPDQSSSQPTQRHSKP